MKKKKKIYYILFVLLSFLLFLVYQSYTKIEHYKINVLEQSGLKEIEKGYLQLDFIHQYTWFSSPEVIQYELSRNDYFLVLKREIDNYTPTILISAKSELYSDLKIIVTRDHPDACGNLIPYEPMEEHYISWLNCLDKIDYFKNELKNETFKIDIYNGKNLIGTEVVSFEILRNGFHFFFHIDSI